MSLLYFKACTFRIPLVLLGTRYFPAWCPRDCMWLSLFVVIMHELSPRINDKAVYFRRSNVLIWRRIHGTHEDPASVDHSHYITTRCTPQKKEKKKDTSNIILFRSADINTHQSSYHPTILLSGQWEWFTPWQTTSALKRHVYGFSTLPLILCRISNAFVTYWRYLVLLFQLPINIWHDDKKDNSFFESRSKTRCWKTQCLVL